MKQYEPEKPNRPHPRGTGRQDQTRREPATLQGRRTRSVVQVSQIEQNRMKLLRKIEKLIDLRPDRKVIGAILITCQFTNKGADLGLMNLFDIPPDHKDELSEGIGNQIVEFGQSMPTKKLILTLDVECGMKKEKIRKSFEKCPVQALPINHDGEDRIAKVKWMETDDPKKIDFEVLETLKNLGEAA